MVFARKDGAATDIISAAYHIAKIVSEKIFANILVFTQKLLGIPFNGKEHIVRISNSSIFFNFFNE